MEDLDLQDINMTSKNNLISVAQKFLEKEDLKDQKILLMVSGGVDSVVMLEVFSQILDPKLLAVFHLNHNLRVESEEDSKFVQKICSKKKIKFYTQTLKKESHLQNQENNWRKLRQKFSSQFAKEFGSQRILTSHHATDLVETMIFRLTKGSGPSGLSPFDISTKPFWKIPKTEIIDFAEKNKLEWREDYTNLNTNFERNLIRLKVLPHLQKITPNLEKVFIREAQNFGEIDNFLDETVAPLIHKKSIALKDFLLLHPALQKVLLHKIADTAVSSSEVEDCLKWLKNQPRGNSQKPLGLKQLHIQNHQLFWEKSLS